MTDATRALPGNRHDEPSSPSPAQSSVAILVTRQVGHFWKADPGQFSKAPKRWAGIQRPEGLCSLRKSTGPCVQCGELNGVRSRTNLTKTCPSEIAVSHPCMLRDEA